MHDYGDLCQAITDLAVERDAPFSVDEFRTLNRCLDNAIADAVTEFAGQRDLEVARKQAQAQNERLGLLAHELRNHLHVAQLAFSALESGRLPVGGSTGGVLKRSLSSLQVLIDQSLAVARNAALAPVHPRVFSVALFLADAGRRAGSEVSLHAHASGAWIMIDVEDCCGGLPSGAADTMFEPFKQNFDDKRGLGLGLSIAKRNVEADGGHLTVQDLPGKGCIFTIGLPLRWLA